MRSEIAHRADGAYPIRGCIILSQNRLFDRGEDRREVEDEIDGTNSWERRTEENF